MENMLLIILLVILLATIWWYWKNDSDKNIDSVKSEQKPTAENKKSDEPVSVPVTMEPILNQTDISQIIKSVTIGMDQNMSNQLLYPQAQSEEQQNNMGAYVPYYSIGNVLVKKYGSKLNNIQITPQKQKPLPKNFASVHNLPPQVSNYVWYIVNAITSGPPPPTEVAAEEKFQKCLINLMTPLRSTMQRTSTGSIQFTNNESLGIFEHGLTNCFASSEMMSVAINMIASHINVDLKF